MIVTIKIKFNLNWRTVSLDKWKLNIEEFLYLKLNFFKNLKIYKLMVDPNML